MSIALWALVSFLIVWGLSRAAGLLFRRCGGSGAVRAGYYVLPLYAEPEKTEALLRHNLARARWEGGGTVLLLDLGADGESLAICEKLMGGGEFLYCHENRFFDTVRRLDAAQERTFIREKE